MPVFDAKEGKKGCLKKKNCSMAETGKGDHRRVEKSEISFVAKSDGRICPLFCIVMGVALTTSSMTAQVR